MKDQLKEDDGESWLGKRIWIKEGTDHRTMERLHLKLLDQVTVPSTIEAHSRTGVILRVKYVNICFSFVIKLKVFIFCQFSVISYPF